MTEQQKNKIRKQIEKLKSKDVIKSFIEHWDEIQALEDKLNGVVRVCLDCESIDPDEDTSNGIFEYCSYHRAERNPNNHR